MAELSIKLLGILFGVLARTLVPYLRKLKQGFAWNSLLNETAKWTEKKGRVQ